MELAHEYKLDFRSVESFFDLIKDEIASIHDYEVPEISAIELRDANEEFMSWVSENTAESYEGEEEEESSYEEDDFGLIN